LSFLLDTNVISEIRRPRPDRNVSRWFESVPSDQLFLSVLTLGEIAKGIERLSRRERARAQALDDWLSILKEHYADRLLAVDAQVAECWGRFSGRVAVPVIDRLLAATAMIHGLTFVTRNVSDVGATGAALLDPWQSNSP
jgi:predicted nucleic acid-binding protein